MVVCSVDSVKTHTINVNHTHTYNAKIPVFFLSFIGASSKRFFQQMCTKSKDHNHDNFKPIPTYTQELYGEKDK